MIRAVMTLGAAVALAACEAPECDETRGRVAGNLILDPGFDQGLLCWNAMQGGQEDVGFAVDNDHPATGQAPSIRAANDDDARESFYTQIISAPLDLEGDTTYDVSFFARAASARDVTVFVQECCAPTYHFLGENQAIGTSWARHTLSFDAERASTTAYFEIQFGAAVGDVWIDDVAITAR